MAWIKLEHCTPDKPEINIIAEALRLDPDCVVGKLFRIWAWADLNSIDGSAMPVTENFLDRITHKRGFAAAMRRAGWLQGEDGCLVFPGFDRHNGETAKARAESARRMAKSRSKRNNGCGNVAEKAQQKAQPDKSKSKKETTSLTPLPPDGGSVSETGVLEMAVPDIVGLYPRREGVLAACTAVLVTLRKGGDALAIIAGTRAIAAVIPRMPGGHLNKFVVSAERFFREERWRDDPQTWLRQAGNAITGAPAAPLKLNGRTGTTIRISSHANP